MCDRVIHAAAELVRLEAECVRCFSLLLEQQLQVAVDAFRLNYSSLVRRTHALLAFLHRSRNAQLWYEYECTMAMQISRDAPTPLDCAPLVKPAHLRTVDTY